MPKEASAVDPAALSTDVEFDGVRFGYAPDAPVIRKMCIRDRSYTMRSRLAPLCLTNTRLMPSVVSGVATGRSPRMKSMV